MVSRQGLCWCFGAFFAASFGVSALDSRELANLSLEQLANLDITSLTKKSEPLSQAPGSLYVVTAQDIRRAGATSLPEALRLAPNLQVAQVDSSQYAISARGFNGTTSNKLQVLIDGRILYTPLYSGVFWDVQDLLLDDVARIEVISGPNTALWGANAVNGVINVVTSASSETQGTLIKAGGGNREATVSARHGASMSGGHYRVYAKFIDFAATEHSNGTEVDDAWYRTQLGFRMDWGDSQQQWQLQGDAYTGSLEQSSPGDREVAGGNLIMQWSRSMASGDTLRAQAYYDYTYRDYPGTFTEHLHTTHIELQHSLAGMGAHHLQWGLDYRQAKDSIENSVSLAFLPDERSLDWLSVFALDEVQLKDNLKLTLSARLEDNDYSGAEFMPAVRLAWQLLDDQLLWAAWSRAVRTPSRIDVEFYSPGQAPYLLAGGPDFDSEIAYTYEGGYRALFANALSWSVTAFYSDYDKLRSIEAGGDALVLANGLEGKVWGLETWAGYQVIDNWRLSAGLVAQRFDMDVREGYLDLADMASARPDPKLQWQIRSQYSLGDHIEWDLNLRYVGELENPAVPAYTALDTRIAWWLDPTLELSLTARNLNDDMHPEFGSAPGRSELPRSIFLAARWSF